MRKLKRLCLFKNNCVIVSLLGFRHKFQVLAENYTRILVEAKPSRVQKLYKALKIKTNLKPAINKFVEIQTTQKASSEDFITQLNSFWNRSCVNIYINSFKLSTRVSNGAQLQVKPNSVFHKITSKCANEILYCQNKATKSTNLAKWKSFFDHYGNHIFERLFSRYPAERNLKYFSIEIYFWVDGNRKRKLFPPQVRVHRLNPRLKRRWLGCNDNLSGVRCGEIEFEERKFEANREKHSLLSN